MWHINKGDHIYIRFCKTGKYKESHVLFSESLLIACSSIMKEWLQLNSNRSLDKLIHDKFKNVASGFD